MKTILLSEANIKFINERVTGELTAEAMYRMIANVAQNMGLFGVQAWALKGAEEEAGHYQKLVNIANDYGIVANYNVEIKTPPSTLAEIIETATLAERDLYLKYSEGAKSFEDVGIHQLSLEFVAIQRLAVGEMLDIKARYDLNGDIYAFDKYMSNL